MKKAKSGRKNRSVICKKSHAQICAAWLREIDAPLLTSWRLCANVPHVLLDGALADMHPQFQQFTPHPFSPPEPIVLGHLPDQGDGFLGDLGLVRSGLGLALPDQAEELPMEAGVGCLAARSGEPAARCERALLKAQGAPVPSSYRLAASPAVGG